MDNNTHALQYGDSHRSIIFVTVLINFCANYSCTNQSHVSLINLKISLIDDLHLDSLIDSLTMIQSDDTSLLIVGQHLPSLVHGAMEHGGDGANVGDECE